MVMGLSISCITLVVVLFCLTYIGYTSGVQSYKYVDFDYKTLSTADYTVEFEIKKKMW